jgi:hypothetical protein
LLALLGAQPKLHVSRIRVKLVLPELFEDARPKKCKKYTKVFSSASRNIKPSGHNPQMAKLERSVCAENTDTVYSHINGIPQIVSSVTAFRV